MKYYCRNCGSEMELTETDQICLSVNDLRKIFNYLDALLESLPEKKIVEFAKSEEFQIYKQLFDKLQ